eukprot:g20336.t1
MAITLDLNAQTLCLEWRSLTLRVVDPRGVKGSKAILQICDEKSYPGEVRALIGPRGAGADADEFVGGKTCAGGERSQF